ncbi:MAG: zinc-ribbon domain-containing protein [Pseudomonadota bacterium]|nr:zinc-ribbon domain-containing protein [Pseudomonadota bacterium]
MEVFCPQCNQAFVLPDGAVPPAGRKMKCSKCAHVWHQPGSDTAANDAANDAAEAPAGAATEEADTAREPETATFTDADLGQWDPAAAPKAAADPSAKATYTDAELGQWNPELTSEEIVDYGDFSILRTRQAPPPPPVRPYGFYATVALIVVLALGGVFGRATLVQVWPPAALLYERAGLPVPVVGAGLAIRDVAAVQGQQGALTVAVVRGRIVNESQAVVAVPTLAATLGDDDGASWQDILFPVDVAVLLPGETVDFQYELPLPDETATRVTVSFSEVRPASGGLGY